MAWQPPTSAGFLFWGYRVYRGSAHGDETLLVFLAGSVLSYADTGVTIGVRYYYYVTAVARDPFSFDRRSCEGPPSNEVSAKAQPSAPSAPQNLRAIQANASIVLDWNAPLSDGGSRITHYTIYRGTVSGGEIFLKEIGTALTYTDTDISNGQRYYYEVSALNAVGEGPTSNEATPYELNYDGFGPTTASLFWTPFSSPCGGANLLYSSNGSSGPWNGPAAAGNASAAFVYNLAAGVTFWWQVFYHSMAYDFRSGMCKPPILSWTSNVLGLTQPVNARLNYSQPTSTSAQFSWSNDAVYGGLVAFGSYQLLASTNGGAYSSVATISTNSTRTHRLEGLSPGTNYSFYLNTTDQCGSCSGGTFPSSSASNVVSISVAPAAPGAPRALMATPGDSEATLSWQAPASDGGSPITNYTIYRGIRRIPIYPILIWVPLVTVGNVLTYVVTGLTNGRTTSYEVSAVNAVGVGARSSSVSVTPRTTPQTPQNLSATPGTGFIDLRWDAPTADGGAPVTAYSVYRGTTSGGETLLATTGDFHVYRDYGATSSVRNFYEIAAVNAAGEGTRSAEVSAIPTPLPDTTKPSIAITSPASGATVTSVTITVQGTASDNAAVLKVEVSVDGSTWILAAGTTTWSATVTLGEGAQTIQARATDTSNNTAIVSIPITVNLALSGSSAGPPWGLISVAAFVVIVAAVGLAARRLIQRRKPPRN